ncbi:MAG: hypothetical protein ACOC2J_04895, partial [bacterium]
MFINHISLKGISFNMTIFLVCGIILFNTEISGAEEAEINNSIDLEEIEQELLDRVEKIYQEYASENFEYVYFKMHPGIWSIISLDDYTEFQKEGFEEYKLRISDIRVSPDIEEVNLPREFKEII